MIAVITVTAFVAGLFIGIGGMYALAAIMKDSIFK